MMKQIKSISFFYLLPLVAALVVAFGCNRSRQKNMRICNHEYALCTSAQCVPQPGDPTKAICFCDVQQGKSLSSALCSTLKPSTDPQGIRTIYSTFSFEQFKAGLKGMKCPSGTPWTWCLNKRCTVDPSHPEKAICSCDIIRSGEWMTLGGNCDTSTCATGYWSGATIKESEESGEFLTKVLGLPRSPVKWCQAVNR
ncbi:MAG: hypothetical protein WA347_01285 [Rhabdochlamydiaceae bacterium]|jgi:hypothetical protein